MVKQTPKETEKQIREIVDKTIRVMNPLDKRAQLIDTNLKITAKPFHTDKRKLTFGQRTADWLTKWAGSWTFIIFFFIFLGLWMGTSGYIVLKFIKGGVFIDNYPFILLNLILSSLAAVQAPLILMSQNRAAQRDRQRAEYDYRVNRKAEKEIRDVKMQLERIERKLKR